MNDDVLITKVKHICKKKPKERSHSDLSELEDLTKNTKVFKSLIETNGEWAHRLCCQYLVYEFCAENNYLFRQGDPGTRFYIIISGNVGVEIPIKDEYSGELKTIEVVSFTKGASFGELALESSKPRAASIKCKSDSHFVALEKVDYNRMIAKMVRDKRDFVVNFISSLPIFACMTKGSLAKMTYNFREKEYIKNQVVYKEGDPAIDAFVIVEGEFLFSKRIKVEDGRKKFAFDAGKYDENSEIVKIRTKGLQKKLIQIGNISKLGIGELFGTEEAENEPRKYSCSCNSTKGEVLVISKTDLKKNKAEDIQNYIFQRNSAEEKEINERALMWKFIAEENASSLSPIELRKREKIHEKAFEREKKSFKLEKNATTPVFSNKIKSVPNDFLFKTVNQELKSIGSPFSSRKPGVSKVPSISKHNKRLSSLKPAVLESAIQRSTRSISPLTRKNHKKGVALYSMNYNHIYEELRH